MNIAKLNNKKKDFGTCSMDIFAGTNTKYFVYFDTWANGTPHVVISDGWFTDRLIKYDNGKIAHDRYWHKLPKYLEKAIQRAYKVLEKECN